MRFIVRSRDASWRRSSDCWVIWIWPKTPFMILSGRRWNVGLKLACPAIPALGLFPRGDSRRLTLSAAAPDLMRKSEKRRAGNQQKTW